MNAIAEAKNGAWPIGIPGGYDPDHQHLKDYLELAQTEEGFDQYLKEHVYVTKAEAAE